jgi:methylase of polypeptide subunit release factors
LKEAADALAPDGILIFEFGAGQEPLVGNALSRVPSLTLLELKHDLQDIPRAAVVQKSARI